MFSEKLLEAQKNLPSLYKDAINPHFHNSYISLKSLMEAVIPVLNDAGLVLLQAPSFYDGGPALATYLIDAETGEEKEYITPLLVDKNNSQGLGSAITYMRRYTLMSILGLVADEDDDGNAASKSVVTTSDNAGSPSNVRQIVNVL